MMAVGTVHSMRVSLQELISASMRSTSSLP